MVNWRKSPVKLEIMTYGENACAVMLICVPSWHQGHPILKNLMGVLSQFGVTYVLEGNFITFIKSLLSNICIYEICEVQVDKFDIKIRFKLMKLHIVCIHTYTHIG